MKLDKADRALLRLLAQHTSKDFADGTRRDLERLPGGRAFGREILTFLTPALRQAGIQGFSARDALETLPVELRCTAKGLLCGRGTVDWVGYAWIRWVSPSPVYGIVDMAGVTLATGPDPESYNLEWSAPEETWSAHEEAP